MQWSISLLKTRPTSDMVRAMAKPKPTYSMTLGAVVAPGLLRHPLPCTIQEYPQVVRELQMPRGAATPTLARIRRMLLLKQMAEIGVPASQQRLIHACRTSHYALQEVLADAEHHGVVQLVNKLWALTAAGYAALGVEPPVERLLALREAANAPLRRPGRPAKDPATAKPRALPPGPRSDAWYREQILRALAAGPVTASDLEQRFAIGDPNGINAVQQVLHAFAERDLITSESNDFGIEVWSLTADGSEAAAKFLGRTSPAAPPPGSPARPLATPPANALPVFDPALPPVPDWSTRRVIPGMQRIIGAYFTQWNGELPLDTEYEQWRFRADPSYVRPTPRPSLHRVLTQYPDAFAGLANPPSIPGMKRQPMTYRPGMALDAGHEMLIRNGLHPGMDLAVLQRLSAKDIRAQERAAGRPAPMMPGDEA